jgi:hypothetical protein
LAKVFVSGVVITFCVFPILTISHQQLLFRCTSTDTSLYPPTSWPTNPDEGVPLSHRHYNDRYAAGPDRFSVFSKSLSVSFFQVISVARPVLRH